MNPAITAWLRTFRGQIVLLEPLAPRFDRWTRPQSPDPYCHSGIAGFIAAPLTTWNSGNPWTEIADVRLAAWRFEHAEATCSDHVARMLTWLREQFGQNT